LSTMCALTSSLYRVQVDDRLPARANGCTKLAKEAFKWD
jgi:hypothetical protein